MDEAERMLRQRNNISIGDLAVRELRGYQRSAVERAIAAVWRNPVVVAPTGSGKTVMGAEIVRRLGGRVLWIAHRRELLQQARRVTTCPTVSIQSLIRRPVPAGVLAVVVDECFPAGTLVDGRPIETLRVGDRVSTHRGVGEVTHVFRKTADTLITITLASGKVLTCTPNHPIWTLGGFVPAEQLRRGSIVATKETHETASRSDISVHRVRVCDRQDVPSIEEAEKIVRSSGMSIGIQLKDDQGDVREARGKHHRIQENERDERSRNPRKSIGIASSRRPQAASSRRKWKADSSARATAIGVIGMADRGGNQDERAASDATLSNLLQSGHREPGFEDRGRGGWRFTRNNEGAGEGREAGCVLGVDWVANIEVHEPAGDARHRGSGGGYPVYNLEVSNGNTYFANDVLVHNCHHAAAGTYRKLFALGVPIIGLTATPFRLDGKPLAGFGELVVAATVRELIDAGHLLRPTVYCRPAPDLSGVKIRHGDYEAGAVTDVVDKPHLVGDIVEHWRRFQPHRSLVYAASVEHSCHIVSAMRDAGIAAEHVDAKTPKDKRDAAVERLRTGETRAISNVELFTEGVDLPELDAVVLARPTASLCLHIQMVGRVMRPGTDRALVLDHAGNHLTHGPVDQPIEYSLTAGVAAGTEPAEPLGLRRCPACGLFTSKRTCPECGADAPTQDVIPTRPGVLTRYEAAVDEFEERRAFWDAGATPREFHERFGEWPLLGMAGNLINPRRANIYDKRSVFESLSHLAKQRGYAPGWASHRYRAAFGVWPKGFVHDVRSN